MGKALLKPSGTPVLASERHDGSNMLLWVMAVMVLLANLALFFAMVFSALSVRWQQDLGHGVTLEVRSAERGAAAQSYDALVTQVLGEATAIAGLGAITAVDSATMRDRLSPWLDPDLPLEELDLPALFSVQVHDETARTALDGLVEQLDIQGLTVTVNDHVHWFSGLSRLSSGIRWGAFLLLLVIVSAAVSSIALTARSRLMIHRATIDLLHVIGAPDDFIARQVHRQILFTAIKGCLFGMALFLVFLAVGHVLFSGIGQQLLPQFRLGMLHGTLFLLTPVCAILVAMFTAYLSVMTDLRRLP